MRHREAADHLPDHGTGLLDADTQAALTLHADECAACRGWLATRDLLADGLSRERDEVDYHPGSELLALCVLRPEEIYEIDRSALRAHLGRCSSCAQAWATVRAAVEEARPHEVETLAPGAGASTLLPMARLAAAAVLAGLLLAMGAIFQGRLFDRVTPREAQLEKELREPLASGAEARPAEVITGRDLEGTQSVEGASSLMVSKLTVKTGADVAFRAEGGVAFGDGFRVAKGARLSVTTGRDLDGKLQEPQDQRNRNRSNG